MAGVTDSVFAGCAKKHGADVVVTEFVSADGILHRNQRTREMVAFRPEERPIGVQLFGGPRKDGGDAARAVVDWVQPDFIDLNFGCPVNKVVLPPGRLGASPRLSSSRASRFARSVQALEPVPVTAKIRLGWMPPPLMRSRPHAFWKILGSALLQCTGEPKNRDTPVLPTGTKSQRVAEAVAIPVIGNGDLRSVEEVSARLTHTKVRGVMLVER